MKNLLVIFGGKSSEYRISLLSATSVLENLPRDKYAVHMLGITQDGLWRYYTGALEDIAPDRWNTPACTVPAVLSPDAGSGKLLLLGKEGLKALSIDCVFPVLHGKNGEDGTLQGLLEIAGLPYVGCDTISSAMCMDKAVTNTLADAAGIPQAKWAAVTKYEYETGKAPLDALVRKLGYPIFVKPANAGSSVGISKAHNEAELSDALALAFLHDTKAVLEETVVGREIECAVMGNEEPVASTVGEILPEAEFYDYDAKYSDSSTRLEIPAALSPDTREAIREAAVRSYRALSCRGLARVDFFLKADGTICLNELNTMPGFTSISMFPKLFGAVGVPYGELLDRLVRLALGEKV